MGKLTMRSATADISPIAVLAALMLLTVASVSGLGCDRPEDTSKCEDPVAMEKRLREEIRAELLAELGGDPEQPKPERLVPDSVRKLGKGEMAAISTALTEQNKPEPMPTKPTIEHVPPPATREPGKLTAADRKAMGDDPAARPLDMPVVEWPTEDDGEKPPPSAKAIKAPHLEPAPLPEQVDTSKLPPQPAPGSGDKGESSTPPPPGSDGMDEATRRAANDDPGRTLGVVDKGAKELREGVQVYPARDGLAVVDLAIAEKMQGRQPYNIADHFDTPPAMLACFGAYSNRLKEAQITHVWRKGNKILSRVELRVGVSAKWRTWSRQRVRGGGAEYSCEVLSPSGKRLGLAVATVGTGAGGGTGDDKP